MDANEALISPEGQKELLGIARKSVEAAIRGEAPPEVDLEDTELQPHCGAFVTLTTHGQLRGCLGCFTADEPIHKVVNRMAAESATQDPRFAGMRLGASDLKDLRVEISVLSPMRRVRDPLREVELGRHGIYIRRGWQAGTYLPQVATEHHMDLEEFLSSCCAHKAGLAPDAWKDPRTEVYVYSAQVFGEE